MKTWITAIICSIIFLIVGTIIGSSGMYLYMIGSVNDTFEYWYELHSMDTLNVLQQIKSGKTDELAQLLEQRIPEWAVGVPKLIEDTECSNRILWRVQRFYEINDLEVPNELVPLLNSLPPRPLTSCEIKNKKEDDQN